MLERGFNSKTDKSINDESQGKAYCNKICITWLNFASQLIAGLDAVRN